MSERYSKCFTLSALINSEGNPVVVEAGVMYHDNQENKRTVQLKFKNVKESSFKLNNLLVRVFYKVPQGDLSSNYCDFEYSDLFVATGEDFGARAPIVLPDRTAVEFQAVILSAKYADGFFWDNADGVKAYLYDSVTALFQSANTENEFSSIANKFDELGNYLDCEQKAQECRLKIEEIKTKKIYRRAKNLMSEDSPESLEEAINVFSTIKGYEDVLKLIKKCESRIVEINEEKIEARKTAEALARQQKQTRETLIKRIAVISAASIIALIVLLTVFLIPATKYNKACKLMEAGEYQEAIDIFSGIERHKDSYDKILECHLKLGNYAYIVESQGYKSFTVPDGVTEIKDNAFKDCYGIEEIILPNSITSIGNSAFSGCNSLTNITIPDGVTTIGDAAFSGCSSLTNITIPDGVATIGPSAFSGCNSLTNITIPDGVTTIGTSAFSGCSSLTSVNIPSGLSVVENSVFADCSGLTSVKIPHGILAIGTSAFSGCRGLVSIEFPYSLKNIGDSAFSGCIALSNIEVPYSVLSIGRGAFSGCIGLTEITLPFAGAQVYEENFLYYYPFGYIFGTDYYEGSIRAYQRDYYDITENSWGSGRSNYYIPSSLEKVTILSGDIYRHAFEDCKGLKSIVLDQVTSIGEEAFMGCSGLTSIELSDALTHIGYSAFSGCDGLQFNEYDGCKYLGGVNTPYYVLVKCLDSELSEVTIHDDTKFILPYAFESCENLLTVTIPNEVIFVGNGAFYNCNNLFSVVIGRRVANIDEYAFDMCHRLVEVINKSSYINVVQGSDKHGNVGYNALVVHNSYYGNAVSNLVNDGGYIVYDNGTDKILVGYVGTETNLILPSYVTRINQYAFYNCDSLTSVTLPDDLDSIYSFAFSGCSGLTSITIPAEVRSISEKAFSRCYRLVEVINRSHHITVSGSSNSNGGIGAYALEIHNSYSGVNESRLLNDNGYIIYTRSADKVLVGYVGNELDLVLPSYVTRINQYAFYNCDSLISVTIPEGVTMLDNNAFDDCNSLTSVILPGSLWYILDYAFYNCDSLTSVTIPEGVNLIGNNAFCDCDGLTDVILPESVTSIGSSAFEYCSGLKFNEYDNCQYLGTKTNPYFALINCTNNKVTSLTIHKDTEIIGDSAFSRCSGLTSITIPDGVIVIGSHAFYWCENLLSVVIGKNVQFIGDYAFGSCYRLVEVFNRSTYVTVEKGDLFGNYGEAGYYALAVHNNYQGTGATKLLNDNGYIIYDDGVDKIFVGYLGDEVDLVLPTYVTKINQYAFYDCDWLISVTIPDGVTEIGEEAFYDCDRLTSVTIPGSVISIGNMAFIDCDSLASVEITHGVASIGGQAFYYCNSLSNVILPDSISYIGYAAFGNCGRLAVVKYRGTAAQWAAIERDEWEEDTNTYYIVAYNYTDE